MRLRSVGVSIAAVVIALALHAHAAVPAAPEGNVRFYNIADSDFDPYSAAPSPEEAAWMRSHYFRMQVYSSYFTASRTAWYPNGWVYKDSYAIKPGWAVFQQYPEWVLRDRHGNLLYIDWDCSGRVCPQYAADIGNQDFRDWWIAEARGLMAVGYKGIWVDDVNMLWHISNGAGAAVVPVDPRTGTQMTLVDWRRYMAEFMEQVRANLPGVEIAHNAIWYAPTSDPYVQRQIDAADYINLERGATDKGLTGGTGIYSMNAFQSFVDFVHDRGRAVVMMDYGTTTQAREYGLAVYLLTNNGSDLMSSNQLHWTTPDMWWSGWDSKLGDSAGQRYKWNGLHRRDFQCGMVLANDPGAPPVTARLPMYLTDLNGTPMDQVTLGAREARILQTADNDLADDCAPPEPASGGGGGGGGGSTGLIELAASLAGIQRAIRRRRPSRLQGTVPDGPGGLPNRLLKMARSAKLTMPPLPFRSAVVSDVPNAARKIARSAKLTMSPLLSMSASQMLP